MNHDRAWVATRKGLFELRRDSAGWRISRTSFLGEPVSMLLPPQGDTRMLAALNLGHFGVKLHASDDAGAHWQEVATPSYPTQPADATGPAWKLVQIWALEAAHGTVWAGTLPGGLFRSGDHGRSWQLVESLWDAAGARRVVRRRLRRARHPFDLPAPAARGRSAGRYQLRRCLGQRRRRRHLGTAGRRHARRLHAARAGRQPEHAGSACHRALRGGTRGAVVPASQRHLAFHRQRAYLARDHRLARIEFRLRRGGASTASRARPGSCRPGPTSAACQWTAPWP